MEPDLSIPPINTVLRKVLSKEQVLSKHLLKKWIIPKLPFFPPPSAIATLSLPLAHVFEIKADVKKNILPSPLFSGQLWAARFLVSSPSPFAPSGIFRKQPRKRQFPSLPSLFAILREAAEWHFLPLNFSKRQTMYYSGVLRQILTPDTSDM